MQDRAGAQWAPDPFGRHELRYWDGTQWSEHVSDQGRTSTDTPLPAQRPREAATPAPGTTHHPVIRLDGPVVGAAGAAVRREVHDDVDAMVVGRTRTRTQARPLVVDLTSVAAGPEPVAVRASTNVFDPVAQGNPLAPANPLAASVPGSVLEASPAARAYDTAPAYDPAPAARGYDDLAPTSRRHAASSGVSAVDGMLQLDDDVVAHLAAAPVVHPHGGGPGEPEAPFGYRAQGAVPGDGAPMTRAQARAAAVPQQHLGGPGDPEGPEVWDWRESKLPEILSGAAVALLIALAAFLGGGSGGGDASPASQTVGSTPEVTVPSISGAQAPTRTTAPKAKISKATNRVRTYRSSTPTTRRTTTASRTTTTTQAPAPTSTQPVPSDSSSTTEPAPSDSSSSTDPNTPSSTKTTSTSTKPTPKSTTSTSAAA